ncbi:MAG TPA: F390 synthetase-related protein [Ktedonobacteraceae bacterium]|nr:F390 synthetase-related protein [Ktedonobacteraceae bacterium]
MPDRLLIATHFLRARWRWCALRGEALTRYQEQRAQRIVAYTMQHSPFYRAHWSGYTPRDWRVLPIVDKRLMMEHFDTFNTRGIRREEAMEVALRAEHSRDFSPTLNGFTIGLSSGTSGHRGLFIAAAWEQAAWAGTILARALHSLPSRPLRVAFFLRSNSNLYEQVGSRLIRFRYFDLMQPLAEVVPALNAFQPHIVVAPPSMLGFLAQELSGDRLHIKPERLISVAEVLEPQDRGQLEAAFNVPVQQIYQCTEGLLAVSCAHNSLHIQEDLVVLQLEPLPALVSAEQAERLENGNSEQLQKQGERVQPIVTDLWRRTQPIIRYRLNDVLLMETQPCTCGSPFRVVRAIEGRCDDICYFKSLAGGLRPFFPDTIRRMILLASPDIADYQAIQNSPGSLCIYLSIVQSAAFQAVSEAVMASVQSTVAQYACCPATVTIEEGLPEARPGVKRRRVQVEKNL